MSDFKKEREARRQKMIAKYRDLLAYWTGKRVVFGFQTQEFIDNQVQNARMMLRELGGSYTIEPTRG